MLTPIDVAGLLNTLLTETANMIEQFPEIIRLTSLFLNGLDLDKLSTDMEIVDRIIEQNSFVQVAESLKNIMDMLKQLVPPGLGQTILDDLKKMVDGVMAIDVFSVALLEELQIQDLVKDPAYLKHYLSSQIGLNESLLCSHVLLLRGSDSC